MGLNECARAAEETEPETPCARELRRRRIKANRQNREYLLAELGRPNLSAVVKTLVEREIQEVEMRPSAVKHRTINGRCRTGTNGRVVPAGRGAIAPRSIRPLLLRRHCLWRHPMVQPMISDNELQVRAAELLRWNLSLL